MVVKQLGRIKKDHNDVLLLFFVFFVERASLVIKTQMDVFCVKGNSEKQKFTTVFTECFIVMCLQ